METHSRIQADVLMYNLEGSLVDSTKDFQSRIDSIAQMRKTFNSKTNSKRVEKIQVTLETSGKDASYTRND